MIAFKRTVSVDEWASLHPTLRDTLLWLHERWPDEVMVITRIFDPPMANESGVHRTAPHRAVDIRTGSLTDIQARAITAQVNANWSYGDPANPSRKVALFHEVPGSVLHLHLQVRDSTRPVVPMATT